MTTFAGMLRKLRQFDPIEAAGEAMEEKKQEILDINREQMYEQGIGNDGKPLPAYSTEYAKIKLKQRGKSIVDIYRKGDLQKEMDLIIRDDEYVITSFAAHTRAVAFYRPTIFGLTDENKRKTWTIIQGGFVARFKQSTGL